MKIFYKLSNLNDKPIFGWPRNVKTKNNKKYSSSTNKKALLKQCVLHWGLDIALLEKSINILKILISKAITYQSMWFVPRFVPRKVLNYNLFDIFCSSTAKYSQFLLHSCWISKMHLIFKWTQIETVIHESNNVFHCLEISIFQFLANCKMTIIILS